MINMKAIGLLACAVIRVMGPAVGPQAAAASR